MCNSLKFFILNSFFEDSIPDCYWVSVRAIIKHFLPEFAR